MNYKFDGGKVFLYLIPTFITEISFVSATDLLRMWK